MHVGRNDLCPCGSGKKYKNCCSGKETRGKGMTMLLAAMATVAVVGLVTIFSAKRNAPANPATQVNAQPGAPQPGPAPPGKVWSQEHGHWHDIATNSAPTTIPISVPAPQQTQNFTPAPQPPGAVPPGKVWSVEHGHWHDVPKQ